MLPKVHKRHIQVHTRTGTCTHVHVHIHIHTCTRTHAHVHVHTYTRTHVHVHTYTYRYTHVQVHTCTGTHTYRYTHVHTCTHTCMPHFLDIEIHREGISIYCKESHTAQYISYDSYTKWNHKIAWIRCLVMQVKKLCSPGKIRGNR